MNSSPSPCKSSLEKLAEACGVTSFGIADAKEVAADAVAYYHRWIEANYHGEMSYLERYDDVRSDPRLLLDGAKSLIVAVFNYYPVKTQSENVPRIASYALGKDYHEVVCERLERVAAYVKETWGGHTRVCVDTAPLRERYWAVKAGVGFIGRNGLLIVPNQGSYCFIGTILTTVHFEPDKPCTGDCGACGACVRKCPAGALCGDGSMDARRCLSYLTIEYRGELPDDTPLGNRLYGCDTCQAVCPHNKGAKPTDIKEFMPSDELLKLDADAVAQMTQEEFSRIFRHSAIKRTKLTGLQRNLRQLRR